MSSNPETTPLERPTRPRADGVVIHRNARWSFAHIALWSGYEYNYVVNVWSVRPDFPKPIRVSGPGGQPRYIAGDVMDWFDSHQEP